ncbi:MAG TPA: alpha/beta fold hydrolase [Acidimicrobiia bacterium]|nr:alpha/beta fold hydrolase [Acidimicrobiia bacterium]
MRLRLVPGFTNTARSWEPVERALPAEWDVQAIDVPDGLDFVGTADALAHKGGSATWVGYSMGARLSLRLALDNPTFVAALVLVSGSPGIESAGARETRLAADERQAQELERDGVDAFLERWLAQRLFETLPREVAMLDDRRRGNSVRRLAHQLRVLGPGAQEPLWDRLPELGMPVLLVAGGYDRTYSDVAHRMASAIGGNAEVAVLPRAGHALHLEQPMELAQLLASWATTLGLTE